VVEKHRASAFHPSLFNNYLEDTIHQIDLLRYLCGEVDPLSTALEQSGDRLLGAVSTLRLETGGLAVIHTSLQAGGWQEGLRMHGSGLSLEVTAFRELRMIHQDRVEVEGRDRPGRWISDLEERGFYGAIEHFLGCVRTRKPPMTDGIEALKTQQLVEALVLCAGEKLEIAPNPREAAR
jgi:virulence factor